MDIPLFTDDFNEFLKLLDAHRVEYLLVGGYAVGVHGFPRATADLDLWIASEAQNAERLVAALSAFGFGVSDLTPALFLKTDTLVRLGRPPFRIELMTSIDGVEFGACAERAIRIDLDGVSVPVIGLSDLRKNKLAAGRHKDLADLEQLPES
jgi:predicted nucleotidyltransferase